MEPDNKGKSSAPDKPSDAVLPDDATIPSRVVDDTAAILGAWDVPSENPAAMSDPAPESEPDSKPPASVIPPSQADEPTLPRTPLARNQARAIQKSSTILPTTGPRLIDSHALPTVNPNAAMTRASEEPPWTLQQFFNGEVDLELELAKRFPKMPMMARIKFREVGTHSKIHSAALSTQDGSAGLTVDVDPKNKYVQMSFTIESMITLRFMLVSLSDMDRDRWLELMQREQGGLAFLWGPDRWQNDYIICLSRKYFTNMYAFSPNNFEAGVRMTPSVSKELLEWLERTWELEAPDDEPPPLLTW